jgi:hypothetical protein
MFSQQADNIRLKGQPHGENICFVDLSLDLLTAEIIGSQRFVNFLLLCCVPEQWYSRSKRRPCSRSFSLMKSVQFGMKF